MRNLKVLLSIFFVVIFLFGCGSNRVEIETPKDPNFLFATGIASSPDLQVALDMATTNARSEIARQVETYIKTYQSKFDDQTGFGENADLLQQFKQATKTVSEMSMSFSKPRKQEYEEKDGKYKAIVLVEYPIGAANQGLMKQLKKREELYTRFRASQAFGELEDEVEKYRDWKEDKKEEWEE